MTDERKRPQYGEYASQAEQRASIRDPEARRQAAEAAEHAAGDGASQSREGQSAPSGASGMPLLPRGDSHPASGPVRPLYGSVRRAGAAGSHRWDLVLTLILLAIGLADLITSMPEYLHMSQTLDDVYHQLGVTATPEANSASAGLALILIRIVLWLLAAGFSAWRLRVGRLSFWIPLLGAVLSYVAVVIVMITVVLSDPAFQTFLQTR